MKLQQQIAQAVQAEIDFLKKEKVKQQSLPANELRKMGLSVFPLDCKKANFSSDSVLLTLTASFPINDTFFYRGCKVIVHSEDLRLEGRLRDIDGYELEISLITDEDFNPYEGTLRVDFEQDDRTLKCMELGIRFLEEKKTLQEMEDCLIQNKIESNNEVYSSLNENQNKAVSAILGDNKAFCIQGPPGTGKTTVLAEAIAQLVKLGKQIIVTAPSNTAIDNLCRRLQANGITLLRLGNDEKIHPEVLPNTIEGYLERKQGKLVKHLEKSISTQQAIVGRQHRNFDSSAREERKVARNELKSLRIELRQLQKQVREQLLTEIPVIAGTPVSLFNYLPKEKVSDVVIMDEAGQSLSPLTWLAASFGKRLVLCGDPQQLPPVVFSQQAISLGLNESLLEASCNKTAPVLLTEQYRFGNEIVDAINPHFYENSLLTHDSNTRSEFIFIDTTGYGESELIDENSGSTYNSSEAGIIKNIIQHFHLEPTNTVILSPYNAQLNEIKKVVGTQWKISTIDSMQGQESEVCIVSLTRSNDSGEIGFLKDYRRTNVAISRSKSKCILIGDSATLGNDKFYASLIQYAENQLSYKSIYEIIY